MNNIFTESFVLLGVSVVIDWHIKALEKINTCEKRKIFHKELEEISSQLNGKPSLEILEYENELFICKFSFKNDTSLSNVVIDLLDSERPKVVGVNAQTNNIYLYGASGTIFEPNINEFFGDFMTDYNSETLS